MKWIVIVLLLMLTGCGTANVGGHGPFGTAAQERPDEAHLPPGQG